MLFALVFALSVNLLELVLFEILGVLHVEYAFQLTVVHTDIRVSSVRTVC